MRLTKDQYAALQSKNKTSKYRSKKKTLNGLEFDSTREARRYQDLSIMQSAGLISGLRRQIPYPIYIKDRHICDWIADFVYEQDGKKVVEDCKGFRTEIYRLKRKMVEAEYGIKIVES